jgi:aldose 1-epimerase
MRCARGACTTNRKDSKTVWSIVVVGLIVLPFILCYGPEKVQQEGREAMFSYRIESVGEGRELVLLTRGGSEPMEARVATWAGANLAGLLFKGVELIRVPNEIEEFNGQRLGTPVLYPTPCRVPAGLFSYKNREFRFPINRGDNHIHGLVRDIPWGFDTPQVGQESVKLTCRMEFAPGSPIYEYFPIEHTLELTYLLDSEGLEVSYRLVNRDSQPLPYGFGLHPYWNTPGSREDVYLYVPNDSTMDLGGLIPGGGLLAVEGTHLDLRTAKPMSEVEMDDVYFPASPGTPATLEWRDSGVKLTLTHSTEFTHLIVYAPPGEDFVCVENMTAAPNAHNLFAQGHERASGLKVVPPGSEAGGWVKYVIDVL